MSLSGVRVVVNFEDGEEGGRRRRAMDCFHSQDESMDKARNNAMDRYKREGEVTISAHQVQ